MRTTLILGVLLAGSAAGQDTAPESELTTATKATIAKGFAYSIRPVASIPDGFPQERQALAGTPVTGEYSDGTYHARDGTYEIYKKGTLTLVRTDRSWLPLEQYTSPLRQDVAQAFDDRDGRLWKRGNVTAGRKALNQLIQIQHLNHRTNIDHLTRLEQAFFDPKAVRVPNFNGKPAVFYESEIAETVAFEILQGPFASLVERGTLAFRNVSGVGRMTVQDGLVRRVVLKVAGSYSYYDDTDNIKRRGLCSLEITADLTKHGEVKVELPKESLPAQKRPAK
jgi:hypothetical protein